jgi:molybdopterin-guanine dinucleotide biosynthesis protein A
MGTAKAGLEWHGSTLLWRTVRILERATGGPVVVARAAGQPLPVLPPGTQVVDDPRPGLGPLQGIAAGLRALSGRAEIAFVASTDLPFLHPVFVSRVLRTVQEEADVRLPVARGFRQPLAAAYRTSLAAVADRLVEAGLVKPAFLFDVCDVAFLDEAVLRADPHIAALDPDLDSVVNVNEPADYIAARARPGPEVTVTGSGHAQRVRAASLAEAAAAAGLAEGRAVEAVLNGELTTADAQMPLVAGDVVAFRA